MTRQKIAVYVHIESFTVGPLRANWLQIELMMADEELLKIKTEQPGPFPFFKKSFRAVEFKVGRCN